MVFSPWNCPPRWLTSINRSLDFDKCTSPSRERLIEAQRKNVPLNFLEFTRRGCESTNLVCGQQRDSTGNSYCATTQKYGKVLVGIGVSQFLAKAWKICWYIN